MEGEIDDNKIRIIRRHEYPFLLRQMEMPPRKMYVQGEIPSDDHKFICVIGSRSHSQYGKNVCRDIILGLRGSPVVIVSGMAIGIDSLAHECALEAGLKTMAFPGSGLDESVLYPRSQLDLARRILAAGGALVSPFNPLQSSKRWTFPVRNALMAGISQAVLVIEARAKSGTMITVKNAGDFGRDLLAVPGSIFSDLSSGPNQMLRDGGVAVTCAEDVLEALGIDRHSAPTMTSMFDMGTLDPDEKKLLKCLSYPKTREELIRDSGMDVSGLNVALSSLEMRDAISEDENGVIEKIWRNHGN